MPCGGRRSRENPMANKPDHEISTGNVFADLGVPNSEEALAKADVAAQICRLVTERGGPSEQTARRMGIGLTELTWLQRGRHDRFSIERMRQFLAALQRNRPRAKRVRAA